MHDFADLIEAVPLCKSAKQRVHDRLGGKDRFYHGVEHVALLWRRHREHGREAGFANARQSRLIACAILFHDCIYAADRTDNEERSAMAWLDASQASDVDDGDRSWVADTIRATQDHLAYPSGTTRDSPDALRSWLLDLDLSPLGEAPDIFDRNIMLLRAETPHLSDADFQAAQRSSLRRFAAASRIYRTPVLATRFEALARRNLQRHLAPTESLAASTDAR